MGRVGPVRGCWRGNNCRASPDTVWEAVRHDAGDFTPPDGARGAVSGDVGLRSFFVPSRKKNVHAEPGNRSLTPPSPSPKQYHQYHIVGRHVPTDAQPEPQIYRMKLWSLDDTRAKSKFW
jgi:hypothetical protein|tara:strand:- start:2150 stop:2509 length:360 start_codon:yes stop_codon:yes gene_type:complete